MVDIIVYSFRIELHPINTNIIIEKRKNAHEIEVTCEVRIKKDLNPAANDAFKSYYVNIQSAVLSLLHVTIRKEETRKRFSIGFPFGLLTSNFAVLKCGSITELSPVPAAPTMKTVPSVNPAIAGLIPNFSSENLAINAPIPAP